MRLDFLVYFAGRGGGGEEIEWYPGKSWETKPNISFFWFWNDQPKYIRAYCKLKFNFVNFVSLQ
jgi:hypothetical protein